MRPSDPALKALLDGWGPLSPLRIADLYTFTLLDGTVARYSGFQTGLIAPDPGVTSPVNVFEKGPVIKRGRMREQVGVQIDELDIEIYPRSNPDESPIDTIGGLPWPFALWVGLFDGGLCQVDRVFLTVPDNVVRGTINRFYGIIDEVELGRTKNILKVKSLLNLLTNQLPRRLYQASCTHIFGDAMCGYDRTNGLNALGAATGIGAQIIAAQSGSDQLHILTTFAPNPISAYDNGSIIGTTGANAMHSRTIRHLDSGTGTIYFLKPFAFPVSTGDQFTLLPGCAHTLDYCTILTNEARFGGFNKIPPPETAV